MKPNKKYSKESRMNFVRQLIRLKAEATGKTPREVAAEMAEEMRQRKEQRMKLRQN